jgi:CubicO group peptidase (beta-lactamase class C family)
MCLGVVLAAGCAGTSQEGRNKPTTASPRPEAARQADRPVEGGRASAKATEAEPKSVTYETDTPVKNESGVQVTVPAKWHFTRHEEYWVLEEPAKEMWIAVVEVEAEKPAEAVKKAWKETRPDFDLPVERTLSPPPKDGWDAITQINYDAPTEQRRGVFAVVRSKGNKHWVMLVDGKAAAFSRRGAQMGTIISSLKVPGVEEESFADKKANTLDKARLQKLESFLEEARKKLQVVGAAMAIVQGGKIIYTKGFGKRKKGGRRPVTPKTLFMIGSMTKSLTTMMMAKLVDQGKFDWETPVTKVYPEFALADMELARKCRMKHTVCACTGMPRQDMEFLFEFTGADAEKRMKLLASMKPTTGFGETFQYSNLMVSAGGYAAAHAAYPKLKLNRAYRRAMKAHLFGPAGMRNTLFDVRRVRRMNHAFPHSRSLRLEYRPIPVRYEQSVVSVGPAGGAWSNVGDMARYLLLELHRGKSSRGRRLVSESNVTKRWKPQARISEKAYYGLGVVIQKPHGVTQIGHGGGTLGFNTNMFFLPDHDVGVVILTNSNGASAFLSLVKRRFMELLFDGEAQAAKRLGFSVQEIEKTRKQIAEKTVFAPKKSWLSKHAGTYENPGLGKVTVRVTKGNGYLDAGEWKAKVSRYKEKDGVEKIKIGAPLTGLEFVPGRTKDGKRTLTLHAGQHSYVFEEVGKN